MQKKKKKNTYTLPIVYLFISTENFSAQFITENYP